MLNLGIPRHPCAEPCRAGPCPAARLEEHLNRVLLLAALSRGQTVHAHLLHSDDTAVMLAALRELGCQVEGGGRAEGHGLGAGGPQRPKRRFVLETPARRMRPLTAALALLAQRHQARYELSGVARMHERPIGDLVDALRPLGCVIDYLGAGGIPAAASVFRAGAVGPAGSACAR